MEYSTITELVELARKQGTAVSEIVLQVEVEDGDASREQVIRKMKESLEVMKQAINSGQHQRQRSDSGLSGGDARRLAVTPLTSFLMNKNSENQSPPDSLYNRVTVNALAVAEVNADMGRIVAGPTAGSSGIVPGVVLAIGEHLELTESQLLQGLFTASGLGSVVARQATLSGAEGGCQAECGVASAMAAGAAVELLGGSPEQVGHGFSLALKNMLGLVCDPVAGLVEVPCVKRNGFAATHALTAASLALAGIESVIPADEVIEAMVSVGDMLPGSLKETALGGLAATPTGLQFKEKLSGGIDN
ncbi:MAG: L-serine ammonia-lyase, iron-sulfur-dependent, subunit alpha [Bacillota bacterium]